MANNVYFFRKKTGEKIIGIQLIRSIRQIEFLVNEKARFGSIPRVGITHFQSILTEYHLFKLGYVAISPNEYRKLKIDVLSSLPDVSEFEMPF